MNKFRKLGNIKYNGKLEIHNSLLNVASYDKPQIRTRTKTAPTWSDVCLWPEASFRGDAAFGRLRTEADIEPYFS